MHLLCLHPYALLALALLPLLALLQLYLPRAPRLRVSSLVFWPPAATAGLDQSAPRRRPNLAALLLLAALAAAILALSGPLLVRSQPSGPAGLVVIDRSPSLLMTDGAGPSRLESLRPRIENFLDSLHADTPVTLELLPLEKTLSPAFSGPAAQARRRLPDLLAAATTPISAEDTRLDLDSLHARRAAPIAFFTDLSPFDPDHSAPPYVHLIATGGSASVVALTRAAITNRDTKPFALVSLFASPGFTQSVSLAVDGRRIADLTVRPGDSSFTLPLTAPLPNDLAITLDLRDDFPLAHRLRLVRTEGRHYRVALVGRPDAALLRLLRAADAEVFLSPSSSGEGGPASGPGEGSLLHPSPLRGEGRVRVTNATGPTPANNIDFSIFIDCLPSPDFSGPAAIINPPASFGPLTATGRTAGPGAAKISDPSATLVLNLSESLSELAAWTVFSLPLKPPALLGDAVSVVAVSPSGDPLIVAWTSGPATRIAVLFDISRANTRWSDDLSFVVFWSNCFRELAPAAPAVTRYQPADPLAAALGDIEGRQTSGPALDQSAAARAAFLAHDRVVRPALFPLWTIFAALALLLILLRLTLKSA